MKYLIYAIFFAANFVTCKVNACECKAVSMVSEAVKEADIVFAGTVLSKGSFVYVDSSYYRKFSNTTSAGRRTLAQYKMLVKSIYKGNVTSDTITIFTGNGGGDCGWPFKKGEVYIVYGITTGAVKKGENPLPRGENLIWTSICQRTGLYNGAEVTELEKIIGRK